MAVRLLRADGTALLVDVEETEPEGYRRRLIGFLPATERPIHARVVEVPDNEHSDGSGVVGSSDPDFWCTCGGEAEGDWIHGDPETYEETGPEVEAD